MKLSIVTITFNNLCGLQATERSIFNRNIQADVPFEWIVVDGKSSDGTREYLKKLDHRNFSFISEPDSGIFDAMNKGVRMASGDIFLFLNSGDRLLSLNILQYVSQAFDVFVFNISPVDELGLEVPWKGLNANIHRLRAYNIIPHQSTIISKRCFEEKTYNSLLNFGADYDFFCWLYLKGYKFEFFDKLKLSQFVYDGVSSNFRRSKELLREKERIQYYYFGEINTAFRLVYLARYMISFFPFSKELQKWLRTLLFRR